MRYKNSIPTLQRRYRLISVGVHQPGVIVDGLGLPERCGCWIEKIHFHLAGRGNHFLDLWVNGHAECLAALQQSASLHKLFGSWIGMSEQLKLPIAPIWGAYLFKITGPDRPSGLLADIARICADFGTTITYLAGSLALHDDILPLGEWELFLALHDHSPRRLQLCVKEIIKHRKLLMLSRVLLQVQDGDGFDGLAVPDPQRDPQGPEGLLADHFSRENKNLIYREKTRARIALSK